MENHTNPKSRETILSRGLFARIFGLQQCDARRPMPPWVLLSLHFFVGARLLWHNTELAVLNWAGTPGAMMSGPAGFIAPPSASCCCQPISVRSSTVRGHAPGKRCCTSHRVAYGQESALENLYGIILTYSFNASPLVHSFCHC